MKEKLTKLYQENKPLVVGATVVGIAWKVWLWLYLLFSHCNEIEDLSVRKWNIEYIENDTTINNID